MNNYDLAEFTKAAMQGLCNCYQPHTDKWPVFYEKIGRDAVLIAKATIWALKKENGQVTIRELEEASAEQEKRKRYVGNYTLEDAKQFWNNGQKLFAVKIVHTRKSCLLSQAKKYCEDNF